MTFRAEISAGTPVGAIVLPLPQPRPRPLAEGFLAAVAERASALYFDTDAATARRRLAVAADGAPLPGPLVSTTLPLSAGGCRHVVLLGHRADWLACRRLLLSLGDKPAASIDPDWLQSPLVDVAALFEGLTGEARQRLLRLFLTTGASLLGRAGPGFADAARGLLTLLGVRRLDPLGWCRAGAAARIVTYRLPCAVDPARLGPLVSLTGATMARAANTTLTLERRREATLLHVLVASAAPEDALLVATGPEPLALGFPVAAAPVAIDRWLAARDAATRAWCSGLLDAAAATDPCARALVRELRHRRAPAPALAVAHLSGTPAGVLHAFHLRDPHDLVRAVRITRGGASATISVGSAAAQSAADLTGYLPLPRATSIDDRCRLALVLHSGRTLPVGAAPLAAFDGAAPAGAAAEAVAAARLDRERLGRVLRIESFGVPIAGPTLSILCPAPACPDLVATRAALAAAEPGGAAVEILYHATEGAEAAAARTLLDRAAATYGIAHRLLVATPDLDIAARIAAAAAAAAAPGILVLGAEVLPDEPGWLAPWRRLSRRHPMLRAAVAGYDGRREPEGGDCVGLFREAAADVLAAATPYGTAAVLLDEAAAVLSRRGTPEARIGLVFRRYGDGSVTGFEKAVDAAALALILKRSFSFACDEGRP